MKSQRNCRSWFPYDCFDHNNHNIELRSNIFTMAAFFGSILFLSFAFKISTTYNFLVMVPCWNVRWNNLSLDCYLFILDQVSCSLHSLNTACEYWKAVARNPCFNIFIWKCEFDSNLHAWYNKSKYSVIMLKAWNLTNVKPFQQSDYRPCCCRSTFKMRIALIFLVFTISCKRVSERYQ